MYKMQWQKIAVIMIWILLACEFGMEKMYCTFLQNLFIKTCVGKKWGEMESVFKLMLETRAYPDTNKPKQSNKDDKILNTWQVSAWMR